LLLGFKNSAKMGAPRNTPVILTPVKLHAKSGNLPAVVATGRLAHRLRLQPQGGIRRADVKRRPEPAPLTGLPRFARNDSGVIARNGWIVGW